MTILPKPVWRRKKITRFQFFCSWTNVLLKNMVVYDVLTFLQTMAFLCSTCVDLAVWRRKKITRKKYYWKNCQVSENSKKDIRTTSNKPYRTKRELSTSKSRSTHVEHTKAIVCKNVNTSYTTIFFNNTFVHEQRNWKYAKETWQLFQYWQ
jgi:hypothetical protein